MSILSVDTIQPIGSGSTVTLNASKIAVGTGITFESNGQAIYAGVVTATSFSGSGANLTGITQTTINNNGSNRIITGSGTANTLEGEATFIYDGTSVATIDTSQTYATFRLDGNSGGAIEFYENGTRRFEIYGIDAEVALYDRDKGAYHTRFKSGGNIELSDGKLLIGTTTAGATGANYLTLAATGSAGLTIRSGTSNDGNIFFSDATSGTGEYAGYIQYEHANNALRFGTASTERLRILSNGGVGINTSNFSSSLNNEPGLAIHGTGNDSCRIVFTTPTKANPPSSIGYFGLNRLGIDCYDGVEIRDVTASYATRMKIDQNGKFEVLSNRASANAQLFQNITSTNPEGLYIQFTQAAPNTSSRHFLKCSDNASDKAVIDTNGNLRNYNASYGGFSDASLKENIVDASSQWNDIKNVKVRVFNFKTDDASDKRIGVVAQEIETVCPKLVDEVFDKDSDGNLLETSKKSVKYSILHMKAIKALQEAQARIETLEAEVAALKGS